MLFNFLIWVSILEIAGGVFSIIYYKTKTLQLVPIINILKLNIICVLFQTVYLHYYRLDHAGRVCAGDFLSSEEKEDPSKQSEYLIRRGRFLWTMLVLTWIIMGMCFFLICTVVASNKAAPQK